MTIHALVPVLVATVGISLVKLLLEAIVKMNFTARSEVFERIVELVERAIFVLLELLG